MLSRHPVDVLIRDLIQSERIATPEEVDRILARMVTVPFDPNVVPVPPAERGVKYLGRTLQARDAALFVHLARRVVHERQWVYGTTEVEYVADLRRAVGQGGARVLVYKRRGGPVAATISRTDLAVPAGGRGAKPESFLVVIYSADRGVVITGYQFSSLATISIPKEASWLR